MNAFPVSRADVLSRLTTGDKDSLLYSLALSDLPAERLALGGVMTKEEIAARYCDLVAQARTLVLGMVPSTMEATITNLPPFFASGVSVRRDSVGVAAADTGMADELPVEAAPVPTPVWDLAPESPMLAEVLASESATQQAPVTQAEPDPIVVPAESSPLPAPVQTTPEPEVVAEPLAPAILRQKLTPEVADALRQEMSDAGLTQGYIGSALGFEQWQISHMLQRKLNAPTDFADEVRRIIQEAQAAQPAQPEVTPLASDAEMLTASAQPAPAESAGMTSEEFRAKLQAAVAAGEETFKPKRFDILCELATGNLFPVERHMVQTGCVLVARCERKDGRYITSLEPRGLAKIPGGTDK